MITDDAKGMAILPDHWVEIDLPLRLYDPLKGLAETDKITINIEYLD